MDGRYGTLYMIPCPISDETEPWDVLPAANRAVMDGLDYFIVENTRTARRFLAKAGIEGVNSHLATALRTMVVVVMAWGMVFLTGAQEGIARISVRSWSFLILSGLATGASWLCYYRALQLGDVSRVVPVDKLSVVITLVMAALILHEKFTPKSIAGCILIGAGT